MTARSSRLSVIFVLATTSLWGTSGPAQASGAPVRAWLCGCDWYWLAVAAASTGVFQAVFFAAVDRTGAGCALLLLPGGKTGVDAVGVMLTLLAACCYGGYTVAAKLLRTDRRVEGVIAASLLGGGLLLDPVFAYRSAGLVSAHGIALIAGLALISTALAYVLFARGLRGIPASIAGTLSLAEPLVAVILAVLVLGERLAPLAIVGASLLLAGIGLASLPPLRRRAPAAALAETPS